ncbi:MAG: nucleotidyltransferase family protein [Gammaproteobacteria bacterium]|nr:nucleotidyltransferase family protein [Gammaproteobacteria bacterium]
MSTIEDIELTAGNMISEWQQFRMLAEVFGGTRLIENVALLNTRNGWAGFTQTARNHQLLPAIAHTLGQDKALFGSLPEVQQKLLRRSLLANVRRNLAITGTALKVSKLMNRAGITPAWIKGTAGLLTDLYPSAGYRQQADIDLVIREEEQETANRVLLDAGYEYAIENEVGGVPVLRGIREFEAREQALARYRHHHHYPPMLRAGDGFSLELHRHPLPRRWQQKLTLDEFYSRLCEHQRNGARFFTPGSEMGIILAIMTRFASDGLGAVFDFPLPQAGDCIRHFNRTSSATRPLDREYIQRKCGNYFPVFVGLMDALLGIKTSASQQHSSDPSRFLKLMQLKLRNPVVARIINTQGRIRHICSVLADDPGKIRRRLQA